VDRIGRQVFILKHAKAIPEQPDPVPLIQHPECLSVSVKKARPEQGLII
jgi:hypothetical protein